MLNRSYKFKLHPTYKQSYLLDCTFDACRFIYNWGLNKKIKAYEENKQNLSYMALAKELTILKQQKEMQWLQKVCNESLQQSLRNLDSAFVKFFKQQRKFPKFKSKGKSKRSAKFINRVHFDFKNWKVKIPKIGWIKICKNRSFDLSKKFGTVTITKDRCGEYWCSVFIYDVEEKLKIKSSNIIGIDLGIKSYATFSNGIKCDNPKYFEKGQRQLKRLQQKLSKKKKGSNRRNLAKLKLAKLYRKLSNRKLDFLHKLTTEIVNSYDTICLEDLNIKDMLKNHRLANSIQSVSWGEFIKQLKYKAEWNGKNILFIDKFDPSSQICSNCGYRNNDIKDLSIREWNCPQCNTRHDRDINAAINILNFALQKHSP